MRLVFVLLASLLVLTLVAAAPNATLHELNGTTPASVPFDRANGSQGSGAYMDQSPVLNDTLVTVCHENLSQGQRLDIGYYSYNKSLFKSVLRYLPQVVTVAGDCTTFNHDFSSEHAIYPGYVLPRLVHINISNASDNLTTNTSFEPFPVQFEGSYDVGLTITGPPKTYYFSVSAVKDGNGQQIMTSADSLIVSVVSTENVTIAEDVVAPGETIRYTGELSGGEVVYVNGLASFEAKVYNPCGPINESGYYIMNRSAFGANDSCVSVNGTDDVLLNFATEVLDGDDEVNGSKKPKRCAILIENSDGVTLENVKAQQYYNGICVVNSNVTVFANYTSHNTIGAVINQTGRATFSDVIMNNTLRDFFMLSGKLDLLRANVTTANIKGTFKDLNISAVRDPPDPPEAVNITNGTARNFTDIKQWVQLDKTASGAFGKLYYHYPDPLPNDVVIDNLSIFKYNGTYGIPPNGTLINGTPVNGSNTTRWYNGDWAQVLTFISPSEQLIIGPNTTNYSVWAPFGFIGQPDEAPEPEPEPTPTPTPSPSAGTGSGGGGGGGGGGGPLPIEVQPGGPQEVETLAQALQLDLQVPERVELQQGEVGSIPFNLTNIGEIAGDNISVFPTVRLGWQRSTYLVDSLQPGEQKNGTFLVAPWERARPDEYPVLVSAALTDANGTNYTVTREVMIVEVLPRGNISRLKILEYPPVVEMPPGESLDVAFLAENIGDNDLSDVTAAVVSDRECIRNVVGSHDVEMGETQLMVYAFQAGGVGECETTVEFYEGEELVGFVPILFSIQEPEGGLSKGMKLSILITILSLWTGLTFYLVNRRRNV